MPKATAIVMSFLMTLALSAIASTSASAAWYVGGKKLASGEKIALSTKAVVDEQPVLNVPTLSLKISCSGFSGVKPEIEGTTKGQVEHLNLEGCSEIEPKTCKLNPSNIQTEPLYWLVHEVVIGDGEIWLLHSQGGTLLATFVFEGSCSLAGEKPITGSVALLAPTLHSEEVSQLLEGIGSIENNSLEVAKNKAYIEKGKVLLKLASGSKWSFR
jgi:hypothetical protein